MMVLNTRDRFVWQFLVLYCSERLSCLAIFLKNQFHFLLFYYLSFIDNNSSSNKIVFFFRRRCRRLLASVLLLKYMNIYIQCSTSSHALFNRSRPIFITIIREMPGFESDYYMKMTTWRFDHLWSYDRINTMRYTRGMYGKRHSWQNIWYWGGFRTLQVVEKIQSGLYDAN